MAVPSRIIATEIDQNLSPRVTPKIAADNMVKVTAGTRIITLNRRPSAAPARKWIITISSAIVFARFPTGSPSTIPLIWESQSADSKAGGTNCSDCDHSWATVGQQQVLVQHTCLN